MASPACAPTRMSPVTATRGWYQGNPEEVTGLPLGVDGSA
jgi:hypothetical protein